MFRADGAAEIEPFLNPEYWGGKMIGGERLLGLPILERRSPAQVSAPGGGVESCLESIAKGETALKTKAIYITGERFSPEDHEPGSVIAYRKEVLVKDAEASARIADSPQETALPFGLKFSTEPSIPGRSHDIKRLAEPPYIYYTGERLGIISEAKDENHPNELIYLSRLSRIMRGGIQLGLPKVNIEKSPFAVGETRRYATKKGAELLIRVNALEVYGIIDKPKPRRIKREKPAKRDALAELFMPHQPATP